MKIIDRSVYVGPSLYAHFPVIRLDVDLGPLEEWPTGAARVRSSSTACSRRCPVWRSMAVPTASPAASSAGCGRKAAPGWATCWSTSPSSCSRPPEEQVTFGKTRSADVRGHYHVVFQYEQSDVGLEAGNLALTLLHSLLPQRAAAAGDRSRRFSLPGRARIVHQVRPAAGPRAQHRLAGPCRRGTRYSLDPAQFAQPDPVRARQSSAADPGHDHQPHSAHRGRAGLRQGGDQQDPRWLGLPVPKQRAGHSRGRCGPGRRRDRLPGRGQAVQRQPWARRRDPPDRRRAGARRLPAGPAAQPQRDRRELHHGETITGCWW